MNFYPQGIAPGRHAVGARLAQCAVAQGETGYIGDQGTTGAQGETGETGGGTTVIVPSN